MSRNITSKPSAIFGRLLKDELTAELAKTLNAAPDPVAYATARDLVRRRDFYRQLAKDLELPFKADVPVSVNPAKELTQQIPTELQMRHLAYPYWDGETFWILTSNPYISRAAIDELMSYTLAEEYRLAVASPEVVRHAVMHAAYHSATIASESGLASREPGQSAKRLLKSVSPRVALVAFVALALAGLWLDYKLTFLIIFLLLNGIYLFLNPQKAYTFLKAFFRLRLIQITDEQLAEQRESELPMYTILVPLKDEAAGVPKLLKRLAAIDYPPEKLDIKFAVEAADELTLQALRRKGIGRTDTDDASPWGTIANLATVPATTLHTKPRSCNFALIFARGTYTVIFDAEDKPDPSQLRKAYAGFTESPLGTACIQGRLNFYNSRQNLLTRMFSLEYYYWFDYFLPGLQSIDSPIPLGGTSNHFVTSYLRRISSWDAFNVTEDADLGMRIFRFRFRTAIMNSYTLEEAVSSVPAWIRQRTRWQKGFLTTWLVHLSHPIKLARELGLRRFILGVTVFGSSFFLPFFNPVLWILFILWVGFGIPLLPGLPDWVIWIGIFNLVFGNLVYVVSQSMGAIQQRRTDLVPFALLLPFYWLLISVATYRATYHFLFKPTQWEKTTHGLTKSKVKPGSHR